MRGVSRYTAEAQEVLTHCLSLFPSGALFLILQGRLQRLSRGVTGAIVTYERIADLQLPWTQLNDMVHYELAWRCDPLSLCVCPVVAPLCTTFL